VEADLGELGTAALVFDAAEAAIGAIDVLVLNHAVSESDSLETFRPETLDRHLAVNVRGSLLFCQEFVRRLGDRGGRIVFMTSGNSLSPMPDELSYATSKGAIESAMLALSGGLASRNITVNAIDPGATDTGWIKDDDRASWTAASPRGRIGTAADAARLVAFLTSDEAEWITGQVIRSRGWS